MSGIALAAMAALLCGVAYRLRGSELWAQATGRGVGSARAMWASVCALACAAAGPTWWLPLAVAGVSFSAATLPQFDSIDIGRREGRAWSDMALQSIRGAIGGAGIAAAYWLAGEAWLPPLLAGAAAGPLYALAWGAPIQADHLGLNDPPESGELYFGTAVGAGIVAGVLI